MVLHSKACGRVTRSELDVKRPEARTSQTVESLELGGTERREEPGKGLLQKSKHELRRV